MGTGKNGGYMSVRCYVDEILIPRLPPAEKMVATMSIRGTTTTIPLEFVRLQPYVTPKIELSDQRLEKVDLRVLPAIFRFQATAGSRGLSGRDGRRVHRRAGRETRTGADGGEAAVSPGTHARTAGRPVADGEIPPHPGPLPLRGRGEPRDVLETWGEGASEARGVGVTSLVLALGLASCAVGPNYVRPEDPKSQGYAVGPATEKTSAADGKAQRFEEGKEIPADWWRLFANPKLDALIDRWLAENPTLQAAQATLRQSQNVLRAGYGVFIPQIRRRPRRHAGALQPGRSAPPRVARPSTFSPCRRA